MRSRIGKNLFDRPIDVEGMSSMKVGNSLRIPITNRQPWNRCNDGYRLGKRCLSALLIRKVVTFQGQLKFELNPRDGGI